MNTDKKGKSLSLVIASLSSGGAERVISLLANNLADQVAQINLIVLTQGPRFYELDPRIKVYEPDFKIEDLGRLKFTIRNFLWLRSLWKKLNASAALSFGGKYNAFVLLSALGKGQKIFVSDRSRPSISYGKFLDKVNPIIYRRAAGIVAQTERAKTLMARATGHKNIKVIPNPVPQIPEGTEMREKVILNAGRFIGSKHQDWLIQYFEQIEDQDWILRFLGEGPLWDKVKAKAAQSPKKEQIEFLGNVNPIVPYYQKAGIFAFTSTSEGFPNALGEAMSAGCPVISFDCEAGPADLIENEVSGYLIDEGNHEDYINKLKLLVAEFNKREELGAAAREHMKRFEETEICMNYLNFMLAS
ncbi:glycosyltransferase [Croceimicrobium hydrocarbonivorans]|uniref:Glycosyltransferase n=1 Tax=Croceimicrobium hydrocarbonivorans TaxID=2761580 RepID=A0A7H0VGA5_9FLAO|nr:glycosyltransferase [Croceimicrobium hydrocarbonivorans]QNR24753.1 glycosyltransferase [Croceimicrobium hydrocarbonivorans]